MTFHPFCQYCYQPTIATPTSCWPVQRSEQRRFPLRINASALLSRHWPNSEHLFDEYRFLADSEWWYVDRSKFQFEHPIVVRCLSFTRRNLYREIISQNCGTFVGDAIVSEEPRCSMKRFVTFPLNTLPKIEMRYHRGRTQRCTDRWNIVVLNSNLRQCRLISIQR